MTKELWDKFKRYGSSWRIEAERDYRQKGHPIIYHLFMFGILYPENYEIIGKNLEKLLKQAIKDGDKMDKKLNK